MIDQKSHLNASAGAVPSAQARQLERGLAEQGISLSADAQEKLLAYLHLLYKWNRTYNLTSLGGAASERAGANKLEEQAVSHHLLDSLSLLPFVVEGRLLDVGSGGGMPGIPLAIALPETEIVLLDSNSKKTAFLRQAAILLRLKNVTVHEGRVEHYHAEKPFSAIVSRAFAELADFVSLSAHLLADNGHWLAMKGVYPHDEITRLPATVCVKTVHPLVVSGINAERHLVVLNKNQEQQAVRM